MPDINQWMKRLFGATGERKLRKYRARVARINALESEFAALDASDFPARAAQLKQRLAQGAPLDSLLEPAFALARAAASHAIGQRHYDVQLIGGMALHDGYITEMKTGEGKTLVATLPVFLNALAGKGAHVVTVNDYLAQRDAEWMGGIYRLLGMEVGCILHGLDDSARRAAYAADITYGTNNELGFDYLRDNMKYRLDNMVQRGHAFAIVDEVDSILIDEARTPLIISGPVEDKSDLYNQADDIIPALLESDFEIDRKTRSVTLTEDGNEHIESLLAERELLEGDSLYDIGNVNLVHHINQALRAHKLFQRDKDYIVRQGRIVIIDEFTGRMMEGRRYSEGLHQALEAKERVDIQAENRTLASVTFQNYFRLYDKLAGMTGTALTEAQEFQDIYRLSAVEIPTHKPVCRDDMDDEVYRTKREKTVATIAIIKDCHERRQPILVGTTSIEKSDALSELLKRDDIPHNVLNARYHEQEAAIIAQAGAPGAVTIATNMAGRGTDIQLGGNLDMRLAEALGDDKSQWDTQQAAAIESQHAQDKEEAIRQGGLFVLGTERHESRRIDNQLRGRSGRQGDPGASKFLLSLEDDLMSIFGSERIDGMLGKLGIEEGEAIVHPWINKLLERAQKRVEARNFDIRKNLLKFDDVMNDQRKAIFEQRIGFMRDEDVSPIIADMRRELVADLLARHIPERSYSEQWDLDAFGKDCDYYFGFVPPLEKWREEEGFGVEELSERMTETTDLAMAATTAMIRGDVMRQVEKAVLLQTLDYHWREHLTVLDHLRQVIGWRGYGQRDPLNEYKTEALDLFSALLTRLRGEVTRKLMHIRVQGTGTGADAGAAGAPAGANGAVPANGAVAANGAAAEVEARARDMARLEEPSLQPMSARHADPLAAGDAPAPPASGAMPPPKAAPLRTRAADAAVSDPQDPAAWGRVGRNAPCPCGSGKKYKHCHGAIA